MKIVPSFASKAALAGFLSFSFTVIGAVAEPAAAQTLPGDVPGIAKDMIDSAALSGDPADVEAVHAAIRDVLPTFATAIDAYAEKTLASMAADGPVVSDPVETPPSATLAGASPETDAAPAPAGAWSLRPWDGKLSAGASSASGNSENAAVSFALDAVRKAGPFTHTVNAYLNIGEANGVLNQKRWGAAYKLDYAISERSYAFGRFAYDEDQFSGFDYRLFAGGGAGYFLKKSEPLTWSVEAGPGYRYAPIDDTREINQEFAVYAATLGKWVIRDGLTFDENARVTWTNSTTTVESTTALSVDVWRSVTTGLSFYYRFETDPPFGRVQTDTVLSATIGYEF